MKIYMRWIAHPSSNEYGSGRNTFEHERREVLLRGYRIAQPEDEGQRRQSEGYDAFIEDTHGQRWGLTIRIEPDRGEE